jgi:dsDNA-specific endonuclease/ATPase MutS2
MKRNAGRLRADMQERIEKSARAFLAEFKNETNQFIAEIASVMERAGQRKAESEEHQKESLEKLQSELNSIAEILENLKENG